MEKLVDHGFFEMQDKKRSIDVPFVYEDKIGESHMQLDVRCKRHKKIMNKNKESAKYNSMSEENKLMKEVHAESNMIDEET